MDRRTLLRWQGQALAGARQAAGHTQRTLADAVRIDPMTLSRAERGIVELRVETRIAVVAELGCAGADLFGWPKTGAA